MNTHRGHANNFLSNNDDLASEAMGNADALVVTGSAAAAAAAAVSTALNVDYLDPE